MNPNRGRESVCRSLFGPVDHDQLRRDLKLKLKEITEQDSRRWNFNFQIDTPLPGRFQWEEIPASCAAALYQESEELQDAAVCSPDTPGGEDMLGRVTNQENCPSISNTVKCPAEVAFVRRKRGLSKPAVKPRCNARITDFFVKRRRTSETRSILNPFITSSSEAALCKTIRLTC